MKKLLLFSLISILSIHSFAQKKAKKSKQDKNTISNIVLEVGNKKISDEDFLYVYNKNRKDKEPIYSYDALNKYMDLYITFQLKVAEAEAQGLDTLPTFITEFEGYRKKLAKPYLTDEEFTKKWAKIEYDRQKEEVNASHILIKIGNGQTPKDTLEAYNKIISIKKEIENGADFGESAIKYSEDPSAKMEEYKIGYKGNLGYFSAFDMVFEFENAAFQNPVGSLVGPIKTQFGYHLLKIQDKREAQPKRDVSHIMIMAPDKISKEDSIAAYKKIQAIKSQVTLDNWNETCAKYSEHTKTKDKGGELGVIKIGGSLGSPEFEKIAFELKKPGDISEPVKSAYGWHIIKYNAEITLAPFEDQEQELINKVSKNGAIVEMGKRQFAENIKKEYNFKETNNSIEQSKTLIDSSYLNRNWTYNESDKKLNLILFTLGENEYRVKDLFEYLKESRAWYVKKSPETVFMNDYENYKIKTIFEFEESNLPQKYPAYRHLVQEYRDGILLFDLMNKTIWSKASADTIALKEYYNNNIKSYQWNQRAQSVVYSLYDTTKYTQLINLLNQGAKPTETEFNKNASLTLKVENKTFEKGSTNGDFENLKWETGIQEIPKQDHKIIVVIQEITPSSTKQFNECKGEVISNYQDQLTKDWIEDLKKKHNVILHEDVLKGLVKN